MKKYEQSIWKYYKNEWLLFYDIQKNSEIAEKFNPDTKKLLIPGSLVMSPKGIGRLLCQDEKISKVQLNGEDIIFNTTDISNYFYIYLKIIIFDSSPYYRIEVPANGDVDSIRKIISNLNIFNDKFEYSMIYNSKILTNGFFDQLEFKNNSKILIYGLKKEEHILKRYSEVNDGWYSSENDSIVFNVDRKIYLCGLGYYGSSQNKTIKANLKIIELSEEIGSMRSRGRGSHRRNRMNNRINDILLEMRVDIPPGETISNCIHTIRFKNITIFPHIDYLIQMDIFDPCDLFYGATESSQFIEPSGVTFNFLNSDISDSTNSNEGNFPEIYYYV